MKNILFISFFMILWACSDKQEEYGQGESLHLKVEGIKPSYEAIGLESFKIPVTITDEQIKNMRYEWRINHQVVSREKDLDIILNSVYGETPACFIVEDADTGMKYYYDFKIDIISSFTKGIFVLSDDGDNGMLSFLSTSLENMTFKTHVFQTINKNDKIGANPKFIGIDKMSNKNDYIVIAAGGDQKVRLLGTNNLKEENKLDGNSFYTPIHPFVPTYYNVGDHRYSVLIQNGKIHFMSSEGATKIGAEPPGSYEAENWIGLYSLTNFVGFDKQSKQFIRIYSGNLMEGFKNIEFFGPTFPDTKLVAGSKDYNQTLRVLMLDTLTYTTSVYKFNKSNIIERTGTLPAGALDRNSVAQLGALSVYWYISKGNQLFRADVNGIENTQEIVTLEEGDKQITSIQLSKDEKTAYIGYVDKEEKGTLKGGLAIVDINNKVVTKDYSKIAYTPVSLLIRE